MKIKEKILSLIADTPWQTRMQVYQSLADTVDEEDFNIIFRYLEKNREVFSILSPETMQEIYTTDSLLLEKAEKEKQEKELEEARIRSEAILAQIAALERRPQPPKIIQKNGRYYEIERINLLRKFNPEYEYYTDEQIQDQFDRERAERIENR